MLTGRVDATLNDSPLLPGFQETEAGRQIEGGGHRGQGDQSAALLAKGQPELLAAINQALRNAKQDGAYQKISQKYFGTDVSNNIQANNNN